MLNLSELVYSARERLVAVEINAEGAAELYSRLPDGKVSLEVLPFEPWLLTSGRDLAQRLNGSAGIDELSGEGTMKFRVRFPDRESYDAALKELKQLTGLPPGSPLAPFRTFSDLAQQAMIAHRLRLFRGMEFQELKRLQLDIETHSSCPGKFCDAKRAGDEVTLISLKDSTGMERCLSAHDGGEAELLKRAIAAIQESDPDVIEGHNIFNFDLDYLEKRCKRYRIPFAIGRGGRVPVRRPSRLNIAERTVNFTRYDIYGRHVVDTFHLVQLADVSKRDMDSYGLKYAAKYYGIARQDRVYVAGDEISELFVKDPQRLMEYCLDDVRETDGLAKIIAPSYFYQTQLLPLSYQNCVLRGNATRIDALLCAEYLAGGMALPTPRAAVPFAGALSQAERTGVFQRVWHIDVRSLYPSVIIAQKLSPAADRRGLFLQLLTKLREFRLAAKDAMKQAQEASAREHFAALQSSFKILINSFYGYLGFAQGTFNDFEMAEAVTRTGREVLSQMRDYLMAEGAEVIEMDTDGIYFVPPPAVADVDCMRGNIQSRLPKGIEIELDGTFRAMFSYKSKNYALEHEDGAVSLHGAALRSRGLEPYLRRFISEAVALILAGNSSILGELYERYAGALREHTLPLKDLVRRESMTISKETYQANLASGKGKRAAVYELALRATRDYQPGDSVRYYVTGTKKSVQVASNSKLEEEIDVNVRDENVPFYIDRLKGICDKFAAAVSGS